MLIPLLTRDDTWGSFLSNVAQPQTGSMGFLVDEYFTNQR